MIKRQIRCIETGTIWPTMTDCCKAVGVSNHMLWERIRFREPINGNHYEYYNPTTTIQ